MSQISKLASELNQNGFALVPSILPLDAVDAALSCIQSTVGAQLRHLGLEPPAYQGMRSVERALEQLFVVDLDRYKMALAACWRRIEISTILRHPAIISRLREDLGWSDIFLPGGDVMVLVGDRLRIPGGYFGLELHQDYLSVQGSLDGLVGWIPLTAVGETDFPMEVIPGSHRKGLVQEVDVVAGSGSRIRSGVFGDAPMVAVKANPGDLVLMSLFTAHRTRTENCHGLRIALSTRFDNGSEPTFVARGFPTAYQRTVHRDPLQSGFPAEEQISALRW